MIEHVDTKHGNRPKMVQFGASFGPHCAWGYMIYSQNKHYVDVRYREIKQNVNCEDSIIYN